MGRPGSGWQVHVRWLQRLGRGQQHDRTLSLSSRLLDGKMGLLWGESWRRRATMSAAAEHGSADDGGRTLEQSQADADGFRTSCTHIIVAAICNRVISYTPSD